MTAIIIDNGSSLIKSGFSSDEAPSLVISSLIGKQKIKPEMIGAESRDIYLGNQISNDNRCFLNLSPCILNGMGKNWDDLEKVWSYLMLDELRINPVEHPVLMIEHPMGPKFNSEQMMRIMFETFRVPKFYTKTSGGLILYSCGSYTGVAVDVGHQVTSITPIYNGYTFYNSVQRIHLGGDDITKQLQKVLMSEKGYYSESSNDLEHLRIMKEKCCFISDNYKELMEGVLRPRDFTIDKNEFSMSYTLPDGNQITMDMERFIAPEILFQPSKIGRECEGIHSLIHKAILSCDQDAREGLFSNIIISGGTSQFFGFKERIENELTVLTKNMDSSNVIGVKTCDTEHRYNCPFIGGSILTSLSSFENVWITQEEYDECGVYSLTRRKYEQYYY